jgi:multidrug efflux pump subunit AcrB
MNITRAAIEKNRVTAVCLFLVFLMGVGTFQTMPRAEDPGFIVRTAMITTHFPGASPERVEMLVTDKLEKAIQEMPEIDFINSESKTGVSVIYVNIKESYEEMRPIWDSLRRKVDRARGDLPEGVIEPFVNDEFGDVFGTIITLTGEGFSYAELKEIADEVRDELLLIEEVAKVEIIGAQEERVFVEYNNARLAEVGLSTSQLAGILESQNIIIPGGDITTDRENIVLEPTGNFLSLVDVQQTLINVPGQRELIQLKDLVHIYRDYIDPPSSIARSTGIPTLALAINLREGGNIILLGEKVKALVKRLQGMYPIGIEFDFVAFQPDHVDRKIDDFVGSLLQAIVIVMLVMIITLGLRTGLVVATLVPMAMITSILVMSFLDIGLDQMSLASLIIALGMLVDNAIVMSESILVQMKTGKRAKDAAIDSAGELRIPLLTSSLTTAAAFLPIYLAESSTGEYTAPLFKVVTITLLASWVLSITMTPMFCERFLKVEKESGGSLYDSNFYKKYRTMLLALLRHPYWSLGVVVIVFVIALQGFRFIPQLFFPPNDKAIFTAELDLPPGTPIEWTSEVVAEIEEYMRGKLVNESELEEGILNWSTYIGRGAPRFVLPYNPEPPKPEYALMLVNATSLEISETLIQDIERFCWGRFPDLRTDIKLLPLGPPSNAPVEVRISGKDTDRVFEIADVVKAKLASLPGSKNIRDNWGQRTKKLLVRVNQPRAQRAGVSNRDIAVSLQTALTGIEITQYREEDKVIPVVLRSVAAERHDIGKLETINVYSQATGRNVSLKQVADIEVVWQPSKILRRDRLPTVTVQSDVIGNVTSIGLSRTVDSWLGEESKDWGIGYRYEMGGENENSEKANKSIGDKLPVAALIIILLLVGQFNSIRRSVIILLTIPLGLIGVIVGLLVAQSFFGFMTLLGIISLSGIVINNAIVLIDRIKIEIEENHLPPAQAVLESAQRRLRPILLTTATTIGGLIPLWLGGGPMWEPMAVSIIFGLLFATMLTLGVVPILYSILFRVRYSGEA